ncbi:MAG: cytochrome C oxidase subunit IV family protein [Gemmatimonadetes bacterium]|nr:cytochrome C oxidase subunit IV family protein [Gemmatimonadota bacterium]
MTEHAEHGHQAEGGHGDHHGPHIATSANYLTIFAALLVLTAVTVWVATVDLSIFNTVVAMAIASVKAILVILYFMHLKFSPGQTKLAAAAAIFWLLILLIITFFDYIGRTWQDNPAGW